MHITFRHQNHTIPWILFIIITIMFFFIDGHRISRPMHDSMTIDQHVSQVDKGRIERRIALICLLSLAFSSLLFSEKITIRINGLVGWLLIFFFVWSIYSIAWTSNVSMTIRRIIVLIILSYISFAAAKHFTIQIFMSWIFFATACYALLSLSMDIIYFKFAPLMTAYRFGGTLHPNHQGINCALLLLSSIFHFEKKTKYKKQISIVILIATCLLLLTKSRSAFFCALLVFTIWAGIKLTNGERITAIILISFTICLMLIFAADSDLTFLLDLILLGREQDVENIYSLTGRVPLWKTCIEYISKRPIKGYGFGAFWSKETIRDISNIEKWNVCESHNAYIEITLGLGLIGLMTYLLMIICSIKQLFSRYKSNQTIDYLFIGLLLIFCSINGIFESSIFFPGMLMFLNLYIFMHLGFVAQRRCD